MVPKENVDQHVTEVIAEHAHREGALLPVLHALQERLGYIPGSSVPALARGLNLSRAEVHGVISFYHDFRSEPPGAHIVQICRAEACQALGAAQLEAHARATLDIEFGQTTVDGQVTLEPVYCLGNCACGPSVRVGDRIHARVDAQRFDALVADLKGVNAG